MYFTCLIYIASNIMNIENQDMLKINNMKACKHKWELEIVPKTNRANL